MFISGSSMAINGSAAEANNSMILSSPPHNNDKNNNVNEHLQQNENNFNSLKYIRSILPHNNYEIESVNFNSLDNWNCSVWVDNLFNDSSCDKWVSSFGDLTKSLWTRVEENPLSIAPNKVLWETNYKCSIINCSANLFFKMMEDKNNKCLVEMNFFHNHTLNCNSNNSNNTLDITEDFFKVESTSNPLPNHIKEQIDGYLLPDLNSLTSSSNSNNTVVTNTLPTTVNLGAIQPLTPNQLMTIPNEVQSQQSQQNQIQEFDSEIFSLEDVNQKLTQILSILQDMLKKSGTSCAAVKQFTDHFERLKLNQAALETALCNFGSSNSNMNSNSLNTIIDTNSLISLPKNSTSSSDGVITLTGAPTLTGPISNTGSGPQWSLTPIIDTISSTSKSSKSKKSLSKKKTKSTVLPGQIDPVTGKRRKRSRCGVCQGCINRNKTQDCRTCRNCLDQKRYGGPGRLKKACVNRSCAIMSTQEGLAPHPTPIVSSTSIPVTNPVVSISGPRISQQQALNVSSSTTVSPISISLPLNPIPVSECNMVHNSIVSTTAPSSVLSWTTNPNPPQLVNNPTFRVEDSVQFMLQSVESTIDASDFSQSFDPQQQSPDNATKLNHSTIDTFSLEDITA